MTHHYVLARRLIGSAGSLLFSLALLIFARSFVLAQTDIFHIPAFTLLDVAYSPNSVYVAYVYADGRLEVLNIAFNKRAINETIITPYPLLRAKVDWSPDSKLLAAGIGSHVYIWQMEETPQLIAKLDAGVGEDHVYEEAGYYMPEGMSSLQWSSDGSLLLAQSLSSRFTVWSQLGKDLIFDQKIGNNPVPVVWLSDNYRISHGFTSLDIRTETRFGAPGYRIPWVQGNCGVQSPVANSSNKTQLAVGTQNGCVVIADGDTGDQIAAYKIAESGTFIRDIGWSPDDTSIVAVSEQGSMHVIDVETGSFVIAAQIDGALYAVDWASDNSAITYGGHTTNRTALATIDVDAVTALMSSDAVQQPEFASTPEASE